METKEKIREIDRQMTALRQERYALEKELIKERQEKLRVAVGLCYKDLNGNLLRIIDVPQVNLTKTGHDFNPYQIPVLKLPLKSNFEYDLIGIEDDTMATRAVDSEDVVAYLDSGFERIPPEKFEKELERRFEKIRQLGNKG